MRRQYAGATPPNRTPVTAGRFVPAIVTTVPPSVTPLDGVTAVSVGTAGVGTGAAWVMRTEGGEPEEPGRGRDDDRPVTGYGRRAHAERHGDGAVAAGNAGEPTVIVSAKQLPHFVQFLTIERRRGTAEKLLQVWTRAAHVAAARERDAEVVQRIEVPRVE